MMRVTSVRITRIIIFRIAQAVTDLQPERVDPHPQTKLFKRGCLAQTAERNYFRSGEIRKEWRGVRYLLLSAERPTS
jgi:hypothetical protein